MIPYNTDMSKIPLPEYGRNMQGMVDYCVSIEDREERTRCAYTLASIMADKFPELVGEGKDYSQIWDRLNIMSGFKLDIDFPCEVITSEKMNPVPEKIPYVTTPIRLRHYGRHIEEMIAKVAEMEESEEKALLISLIAHHMKKLQFTHNKEGVDDAKILRDLRDYSQGAINLDPATYLLHEFREEEPEVKPQGKAVRKKNKTAQKKKML